MLKTAPFIPMPEVSFFYLIIAITTAVIFFFFLIKYYKNGMTYKNSFNSQNKLIKIERQRISSEIHDEVGSGLTAIKLFTEHASRIRPDVKEIQTIKLMIDEITQKINEIIWSTNTEDDHLESLIYFIEEQIRQLFEHTQIRFRSELPTLIPDCRIDNQSKRECYLLIKEIAHNALKHAKATEVKLTISFDEEQMIISVKDNGIGFNPELNKGKGMGMENIKIRTERLKGSMIIERYKGTMVNIKIPIMLNLVQDGKK